MAIKMTRAELNEKVSTVVARVANQTDEIAFSTAMRSHLLGAAYLHRLSPNNQMLAIMQGATGSVMSYGNKQGTSGWLGVGRRVKKGEKGMVLIRPVFVPNPTDRNPDNGYVYFVGYYAFDVSQTEVVDGSKIPAYHEAVQSGDANYALTSLMAAASALGVTVTEETLSGSLNGYSANGSVVIADKLVGTHKVSTLAHELAHEILHQSTPHNERDNAWMKMVEYEATVVAATILDYFNLTGVNSACYAAMYGATSDEITATLMSVQKAVSIILKAAFPMDMRLSDDSAVATTAAA